MGCPVKSPNQCKSRWIFCVILSNVCHFSQLVFSTHSLLLYHFCRLIKFRSYYQILVIVGFRTFFLGIYFSLVISQDIPSCEAFSRDVPSLKNNYYLVMFFVHLKKLSDTLYLKKSFSHLQGQLPDWAWISAVAAKRVCFNAFKALALRMSGTLSILYF